MTTDHDQQSITGKFVIVDIPNDQLPLTWKRLVAQAATRLAWITGSPLST